MVTATATCENDDNGHVHVYVIPQSTGHHIELEHRVEEDRSGVAGVTVWRVREPVEPWLPAANYTLIAHYGSVQDAFADHGRGASVPVAECTVATSTA